MDDEQGLIARAQRGDVQAYESLVRQYEQIVFRAAFLITHDPHEAADAGQDAFLRAYQAIGSFKLGQPFRPWILRIITNVARNRIKSTQRRVRMAEQYARQVMVDQQSPLPERVLAEREQNERLLQAVGRLSDAEQTLIALRYFLELSEGEVAETLQMPVGTVKSRLHRTLAHLREIVQCQFPDLNELTVLDG